MLGIGEFIREVFFWCKLMISLSLHLLLLLSLLPSLFSDGVEVVVKVFPKHDEKVQLGLYDKRLTGNASLMCYGVM